MSHLWQDLRYGLRSLAGRPGFTLVAILTLALGIGANTAIFSVLDAVLLKPLPYHDPDRLFVLWERPPSFPRNSVAVENFLDWRRDSRSFAAMAATSGRGFNLSGLDQPEKIQGQLVSANYFDLLGVHPALGRAFLPGEDEIGNHRVVILTHRLWKTRLGGDPQIINREITLDGEKYTVVGILPAEGSFDRARTQLFAPLAFNPQRINRSAHFLNVYARLKPDVTIEQAQSEMDAIAARISELSPETNKGWGVTIDPLRERLISPDLRRQVLVLFASVFFVLLIACANLANLSLARAATRQREISIRAALGATRRRLLQQLLTESLLLSLAGGAAGIIAGYWLIELLLALLPAGTLPAVAEVRPDARLLVFTLALTLATGILFGLAPAWHASRPDLNEALKESGKASSPAGGRRVFGQMLIVAEVAAALVLLVGAGLFVRSLLRLERAELGFDPAAVVTMHTSIPRTKYQTPEQILGFYTSALAEIERIPGVESAGLVTDLPIVGWSYGAFFAIVGREPATTSERPGAHLQVTTPGYFRALSIPITRGRGFDERDGARAPQVAIINEMMARRYFAGEDPIGKRLLLDSNQSAEIVGVVGDVRVYGLGDRVPEQNPEIYLPLAQTPQADLHFAVKAAGDEMALAESVRRAIQSVDRDQPVTRMSSMTQVVNETVSDERFNTLLIGLFAAAAMALAAIGLYGIISYSVAGQKAEIGIRLALGAQTGDIMRLVIGRAMVIVGAGLVLGLGGALVLVRAMARLLYGTSAYDPLTFIAASALLVVTGFIAAYLPARRATRIDPIIALRHE